ncbi:unnamed protein product [Bursaphelenchus xylophilus]|uniref:(pine wood nematode) hypothetical protein n=1 Tax=Bursaphelenchus xylophilus TaxID=6326 RepID=A0A1I7RJE8_BURXY|nr:unnamed protein product [Bursaphelenchus xylophilus]CAG9128834.1 unnamed protein product [Bursaphelenchus xylophilus]
MMMKQNIDLMVFVFGVALAFMLVERPGAGNSEQKFVCIKVSAMNSNLLPASSNLHYSDSSNIRCMPKEELFKLKSRIQTKAGSE